MNADAGLGGIGLLLVAGLVAFAVFGTIEPIVGSAVIAALVVVYLLFVDYPR